MIVSNDFVRIEQRRSRVWLPLWAGEPRTAYSIIMKYTELKSTKTTSARLLSILTCTAHIAAAWYIDSYVPYPLPLISAITWENW